MTDPLGLSISDGRALRAAAQSLFVDAVTAETVRALDDAHVESLLLKGPAIVSLLYGDGAPRFYVDCDLLVAPADVRAAGRVLAALGFERVPQQELGFWPNAPHAQTWARTRDGANVDLHGRVALSAPGRAALGWTLLCAERRTMRVGGTRVSVPGESRIALLVGVHAAQHGPIGHALADLGRALDGFDRRVWSEASRLARDLGLGDALATALQMLPQGIALARELGLSAPDSIAAWLTISSAPPGAMALDQLLRTPGLLGKLAFARARVFPSRAFMRATQPLARHGRAGLLAAHGSRLISIAIRCGPVLRSWLRARRRKPTGHP